MTVVAITVFVVAYALIASDRVNKTLVALSGAAIVAAVGVVESDDVFFSRETGIDWDVIFLLLGIFQAPQKFAVVFETLLNLLAQVVQFGALFV